MLKWICYANNMMGTTSRSFKQGYSRSHIALISLLLLLAIVLTVIAANSTIKAFQTFQQENELARRGDVSTIRAWMTVPYISRHYHVPESFLYDSLHLNTSSVDRHTRPHLTLTAISIMTKRNVNDLVLDIQQDIRRYHQQHHSARCSPHCPSPPPSPQPHHTVVSGRNGQ